MSVGSIFKDIPPEGSNAPSAESSDANPVCAGYSQDPHIGCPVDSLDSKNALVDYLLGAEADLPLNYSFDLDEPEIDQTVGSVLKLNDPIEPDWFFKQERENTPRLKHSQIYRIFMNSMTRRGSLIYDESIGYWPVFNTAHALERVEEVYSKFRVESASYEYAFDRVFTYGGKRKSVRANAALYRGLDKLTQQMPHFAQVIDAIRSYFLLKEYYGVDKEPSMRPILLDGPSGVGKTYFFTKLAETLSVYSEIINVSTLTASFVLTGSDPRWNNGSYGKLLSIAMKSKTINPMVFLEEIDKIKGEDFNKFPVTNVLVDLLEPESASRMNDECFDLSFDASKWLIFAASNRASVLPPHILNRFQIFSISRPAKKDREVVCKTILENEYPGVIWADDVVDLMVEENSDFRTFKEKANAVFVSYLKKKGVPDRSDRPVEIGIFDLNASGVKFKREF